MSKRGKFIVFEGGEGAGKSSQAKRLADALDAVLTREPGGTELGEQVRDLLLHGTREIAARAELLLMVAARAEHVSQVIEPALADGRHVVCERFSGSTLAYQGFGRGLPLEDVEVACELAAPGLRPDLTVLLDVPLELARQRVVRALDRIEAAEDSFHQRVNDGFLQLARADERGWTIIDASRSLDEVTRAVFDQVHVRLGLSVARQ